MQAATKQHIVGMLTMIRQACHSVEAAIAADAQYDNKPYSKAKDLKADDEADVLSDEQEDMLGRLLGLSDEKTEKVTPQKAKKSNEKLPIS